jgi:hypothetical protein
MTRPCPICEAPVPPRDDNESFPFCSSRCRLIDLGKWLDEDYTIPVEPAPDADAPDDLNDD